MQKKSIRTLFRKLHRWIFIYLGAFMFLWVVTGIMISVPTEWLDDRASSPVGEENFKNVQLSPAQAIASLGDIAVDTEVKSLEFRRVQGKLLYAFKIKGTSYTVNAITGEEFKFTAKLAESIIRDRYKISGDLIENTTINKHIVSYSWGPLPVSYLRFKGESGGYLVKHANGDTHKTTVLTKARFFSGMLHSFHPIRIVTGSSILQHIVLLLTGIVSFVGVIMGLYLVLPKRWQH